MRFLLDFAYSKFRSIIPTSNFSHLTSQHRPDNRLCNIRYGANIPYLYECQRVLVIHSGHTGIFFFEGPLALISRL